MLALEACVGLASYLMAAKDLLYEDLDLLDVEDALVVSIDGVEYVLIHFAELLIINQDIR